MLRALRLSAAALCCSIATGAYAQASILINEVDSDTRTFVAALATLNMATAVGQTPVRRMTKAFRITPSSACVFTIFRARCTFHPSATMRWQACRV